MNSDDMNITRIADKKRAWITEGLELSVELPHQIHSPSPYVG